MMTLRDRVLHTYSAHAGITKVRISSHAVPSPICFVLGARWPSRCSDVLLGIGLLGEADKVGSATAVGEVLCGLVACAGVFALARFHPETEQRRVQSTDVDAGGAAIASRSDRSDGRVT